MAGSGPKIFVSAVKFSRRCVLFAYTRKPYRRPNKSHTTFGWPLQGNLIKCQSTRTVERHISLYCPYHGTCHSDMVGSLKRKQGCKSRVIANNDELDFLILLRQKTTFVTRDLRKSFVLLQ